MKKKLQIFFDFLRFCIGSADEIPSSLKEADWKELYAIAQKQCLVGILFDGIKKLPAEYVGMKKELLLQWMAESQMLEKANVRLNDAAIQVSEWFRKKGFRTCILKGQGNALMYPNPYSRTPGDIDIWVEGGDKRVISFIRSISPHEKACYHHIEFPSYKGVEVEVHYRPSFLLYFWHNRRLQKYYEKVKEEQFSHQVMLGEQGEIAIPSKTPQNERKRLFETFKGTNLSSSLKSTDADIEVLVSVDLFSEGFDCPDVEFIQLARPTLSLAKYMQMVGRGLRVAEGKEYCVILDNVGLYKRFGLPSVDRNWQSMFEGKASLEDILQEACLHVNSHNCRMDAVMDGDEEMMKIINHERQQRMIMESYGFCIVENDKGLLGIKDRDGNGILDCIYKKIEVTNDGFAYCYIRKKAGRKEWLDLRNGLWFAKRPQSIKLLGIDFCTEDGKRLYPRIRSKFIDEKAYLTVKTLELQVGTGVSWKRRFIPWDEPNKVYMFQKGEGNSRLYMDDEGHYFVQKNIGCQLVKVNNPKELTAFAEKDKQERENETELLKKTYTHYEFYPTDRIYPATQEHRNNNKYSDKIKIEKDGIWHVEDDWYHESYWVDPVTQRKHYTRPSLFKRGFVSILKEGDWCYIRNIPGLKYKPLKQWEIVADDNICVINNTYLIEKSEPDQWYKICRRTDDFSYFSVLACYYESEHIKDDTEIQITQFDGEGLKMTQKGMPYTPIVIKTRKRSRW